MKYRLTAHARERMEQSGITEDMLATTVNSPEARIPDESSKYIYQRRFIHPSGKRFMLRVVVDEEQMPVSIVTIYAASRYSRYLR